MVVGRSNLISYTIRLWFLRMSEYFKKVKFGYFLWTFGEAIIPV